jgi:hypothetical protein
MWYNGVGAGSPYFLVGHATSADGILWSRGNDGKPVLRPSTVGSFAEGYVYNVFVNSKFEPAERFDMWYSAEALFPNGTERLLGPNHNAITHAVSVSSVGVPIGDRWHKDATPTLTNGKAGDLDDYAAFAPAVAGSGSELTMYYSMGKSHLPKPTTYRIGLAFPPDSPTPSSVGSYPVPAAPPAWSWDTLGSMAFAHVCQPEAFSASQLAWLAKYSVVQFDKQMNTASMPLASQEDRFIAAARQVKVG